MSKRTCRLVAYYRVSTAKQGQSGLGLEAQEAAVAAHVRASGCVLVGAYTEVESGKRSDRPELAKALAHARRAGATLVIAKLDRLSRNVHFLSGLMEAGVDFVCCDMPSATRLTLHIMAAVAEDEARRISQRTKDALAAYKARGGKLGGVRPGQRFSEGAREKGRKAALESIHQAADEAYYEVTPEISELRAAGMSLAAIAAELNARGRTTRRGAAWSDVQVMRVLRRIARDEPVSE